MIPSYISEKKDELLKIAQKHGAYHLRIFGSVARGEDRPDSDVDFLVEVKEPTSSWFPAGMIIEFENLLGRHVDIVTDDAIYPALRKEILKEAVSL